MSALRITWRKSAIGYASDQRATIQALGLRRLHHTVEQPNTPAVRGMVHKVRHLVDVNGVAADSAGGVAIVAGSGATAAAEGDR